MNRRTFKTALAGLFAIIIANYGCTKLDTTTLGTDVIPVVDNINTFADTLDIISTQHIFDDTVKVFLSENHLLGKTTDPVFGNTDASIYFQFKPTNYPFYWGQVNDTILGLDSVVLSLAYKGFYGDSSIPQRLEVTEVALNSGGLWDSTGVARPVSFEPTTLPFILGTQTVDIRELKNQVKFSNGKDSTTNQIRIKLDYNRFLDVFNLDSTMSGSNNGFYRDSIFKTKFNGLGVRSVASGNALMYINLADANSRLEFHYRKRKNNVVDTIYNSLKLRTTTVESPPASLSVSANHVVRDRSGSGTYPPLNVPVSEIYLQTTPGTYALLKIPQLSIFKDTNRIIHRAEIFMQQIPGDFITDSIFPAPNFLYMDLRDTTVAVNYKPIYFDLNPSVFYNPDYDGSTSYFPGQVDYAYFGGYQRRRTDEATGRGVAYYNFNLTRYVQKMVINNSTNYTLRLFSPYSLNYPQFTQTIIPYSNSLAFGRVKVGGGRIGAAPAHPMKMVIIWSKIK